MLGTSNTFDKISVGQLQIYSAVAKHELRKANQESKEIAEKLKSNVRSADDYSMICEDPQTESLVRQQLLTKNRANKFRKRIEAINLLLEYKDDMLQLNNIKRRRLPTKYSSFSEFLASKKLESEFRDKQVSSCLTEEKIDKILEYTALDISDIKKVLEDVGLSEKEILSIIAESHDNSDVLSSKKLEGGEYSYYPLSHDGTDSMNQKKDKERELFGKVM